MKTNKKVFFLLAIITTLIFNTMNIFATDIVFDSNSYNYVCDLEKLKVEEQKIIDLIETKNINLQLNQNEKKAIEEAKNKTIKLAEYPICEDKDNESLTDFNIKLINSVLGINLVKDDTYSDFSDIQNALKDGKIDIAEYDWYGENFSKQHSNLYDVSQAYSTSSLYAIGKTNFASRKLATSKFAIHTNLDELGIFKTYKIIPSYKVMSVQEGIKALNDGIIDYFIVETANVSDTVVSSKLKYTKFDTNMPNSQNVLIANKGKHSDLISAIGKVYSSEMILENYNTYNRMLNEYRLYSIFQNSLTQKEKDYIAKKIKPNVMLYNMYTLSERNSYGNYSGYICDVLGLISKASGIEFDYRSYDNPTGAEVISDIKSKKLDFLPYVMKDLVPFYESKFKEENLRFYKSSSYSSDYLHILKSISTSEINSYDDLKYSSVGYDARDAVNINKFFNDELDGDMKLAIPFVNNDALVALKEGKIKYYIAMPGVISHFELMKDPIITTAIDKYSNIELHNYEWEMASTDQENGSVLMGIINKTFPLITEANLRSKWFDNSINYKDLLELQKTNQTLFLVVIITASSIIVGLFLLFLKTRKNNVRFKKLSTEDYLTGLNNRLALELDLTEKQNYLFILFDIDKFRQINDLYGTIFADKILCAIANRITNLEIEYNYTSYRLNSDEFAIIISSNNKAEFFENKLDIVNTIVNELSKKFVVNSLEINVNYSFGIVNSDIAKTGFGEILTFSEMMLKESKLIKGTHFSIFNEDKKSKHDLSVKIENVLYDLKVENILPYYQPFIDSKTGKVIGCEVLSRLSIDNEIFGAWQFIPVAQQNGVLNIIDRMLLISTIRTRNEMLKSGIIDEKFYFSINISAQLLQEISKPYLEELLASEGLKDFSFLQMEILEEFISADNINTILNVLNEMNIRIAIDDFSAGHSSLTRFSDLDFTVIKIDKSLLPIDMTENHKVLYSSVVDLMKKLQIKIVAEGVETEEQATYLKKAGVDIFQGYNYSKPIPLDEFCKFIEKYKN